MAKPIVAIPEQYIQVGHKHQGNVHLGRYLCHQIKHLVRGDPLGQGANVGILDHRPLGNGIGEGNAHLDQIAAVLCHF